MGAQAPFSKPVSPRRAKLSTELSTDYPRPQDSHDKALHTPIETIRKAGKRQAP